MQIFGKFSTNFDMDYLVQHYIYINQDDEQIDVKRLEQLLKKKSRNVAGTIFLFNPIMSPIGYDTNSTLDKQGFKEYDKFVELNPEPMSYILAAGTKQAYKGKLIEIKYLFGLNRANIEPTPIMEEFDADLDKYNSDQFTRYDKQMNYQDVANIRLNGKFVFFGSGHKYDRHHKAIIAYARSIPQKVRELGKEVAFMYDNNHSEKEAEERSYFLSPLSGGKVKDIRANGFKKAFETNPPTTQKLV